MGLRNRHRSEIIDERIGVYKALLGNESRRWLQKDLRRALWVLRALRVEGMYELEYLVRGEVVRSVVEVKSGLYVREYDFVGGVVVKDDEPVICGGECVEAYKYECVKRIRRVGVKELPLYVGWVYKSDRFYELLKGVGDEER